MTQTKAIPPVLPFWRLLRRVSRRYVRKQAITGQWVSLQSHHTERCGSGSTGMGESGKSEKASWDAHAGTGRQNKTWWGRMFQADQTADTKALWGTASWRFRSEAHSGSCAWLQGRLGATLNSGAVTTSGWTPETAKNREADESSSVGGRTGAPPAEEPRSAGGRLGLTS